MTAREEHLHDRRRWLSGSLRYATVAGISVLSASLLMRRGADADSGRCPAPVDCDNCPARQGCKHRVRNAISP